MSGSASPRILVVAAWLAAAEVGLLAAVVLARDIPAAPYYISLLALKLPFCWLLPQRRAGAYLAVLLWEFGGLAAALVAPFPVNVLEAAVAGTVIVLLVKAAALFPTVTLPAGGHR